MKESCPTEKTVLGWSDDCIVRYSKRSLLGVLVEDPNYILWNVVKVSDDTTEKYSGAIKALLEGLHQNISAWDNQINFVTGQSEFSSSVTLYGMAQCTPDLSQKDCSNCINNASIVVQTWHECKGRKGARALLPSCLVRYEEYNFFQSSHAPAPGQSPSLAPVPSQSQNLAPIPSHSQSLAPNKNVNPSPKLEPKSTPSQIKMVISITSVAGSLFVLLGVAACFIFLRKWKLRWSILPNRPMDRGIDGDYISIIESLHFNFSVIRAATGNFSEANKLGEGGFGAVYKGMLPDNRQEIAVKRLAGNSAQGENEFKTEVMLLAKLQHRNLVRLLGFCFHDKERLLIYEFVANASLDHFLFGSTQSVHLDWETRYRIIRGIARGILYLHQDSRLRIVHRDLKASNVLLDAEMCPKIADFGTARLLDANQTHTNTRRIVGTYGYMAPEYVLYGSFSTKSDVYSFGILLLEIICGKRCSTMYTGEFSGSLISMIWRKWTEGTPFDVINFSISDGSKSEILKCIHIGLLCIQDNMVDRPTMSSIVHMMSSDSLALPLPSHPAYVITSNMPLKNSDNNWLNDHSTDLESITELNLR